MTENNVKIMYFVEHITAKWNGVVYEVTLPDGRVEKRVCNAHFDWDFTEERAKQVRQADIDLPMLLARMYGDEHRSELHRKYFGGSLDPHLVKALEQKLYADIGEAEAEKRIKECFEILNAEKENRNG